MPELQHGGMQSLPLEVPQRGRLGGVARLSPIDRIADHGAADMGQMDAHLMGPAGAQTGANEAGDGRQGRSETPLDPVLGQGRPAPGAAYGHALAVDRMAADGGLDRPLRDLWRSPYQGLVDPGE